MPLLNVEDIKDRQVALQFLNGKRSLVDTCKASLKGLPDLEKLISAIHVASIKYTDHPESRANYYDGAAAKAKVARLVSCLDGLITVHKLVS